MPPAPPNLANVPMGGTIVPGGAVFRVWAPRARAVHVCGDFNNWKQDSASSLSPIGGGHWARFVPGLEDGDQYLFYIDGSSTSGYKRDPRARALTFKPAFPFANCVLRDPNRFRWHEPGFSPRPFNDLVIYQLHVGTFSIQPGSHDGCFLDVIERVPYLDDRGRARDCSQCAAHDN
jgi:1,4-alpha-glucan branching enzyme